jgi:hypothetical protein
LRQALRKAGRRGSRFIRESPLKDRHREFGMIKDLVVRNRTYRRFDQSLAVGMDTLKDLVDLARPSGSAGNKQPLKYLLSFDPLNALCAETIAGRYRSGLIRNKNFRGFLATGIHCSFNQFFLKGGIS